jgi:hypothetical protein
MNIGFIYGLPQKTKYKKPINFSLHPSHPINQVELLSCDPSPCVTHDEFRERHTSLCRTAWHELRYKPVSDGVTVV